MSPRRKTRVGIIFGGRSVEHEVSVITGIQAAHALDSSLYEVTAVYISKDGDWFVGEHFLDLESYKNISSAIAAGRQVRPARGATGGIELIETKQRWFQSPASSKIDVVLVAMHGAEGENGSLQGTLEVLNAPYTGSDVAASAIGMDKSLAKAIARSVDVPALDELVIADKAWVGDEEAWLTRCEESLGFPVIVKPLRLGSSIGIATANGRDELDAVLEETFRLDNKALVEPCILNLREFNCSVLMTREGPRTSVIEEPVRASGSDVLSFEQKYQRGRGKGGAKRSRDDFGMASLDRIIPAKVPDDQAGSLQDMALRVYEAIGAGGVARVDFLYNGDDHAFYFNEINTIPGSFSFYLWEPSGVSFNTLLDELLADAIERHRSRNAKVRSYDTNLLSENALSGLKGK